MSTTYHHQECPMHGHGWPGCEVCEIFSVGLRPDSEMVLATYARHMSASHLADAERFLALADYIREQDGPHTHGARQALDAAADRLYSFAMVHLHMAASELGELGAESGEQS